MSLWSGQGGHVKSGLAITVPVADWECEKLARLTETTTSASGERRSKVLSGGTFTFNTPWDNTQLPEDNGFVEGADLPDIRFFLGASGKMFKFAGIIERVRFINNAVNDVVRLSISGYAQGPIGNPVTAT
jgi:hypothetical protein